MADRQVVGAGWGEPRREEGSIMMAHAGHSLGWFALAWAALCIVASALVTDTLLRDTPTDRT